MRRGSLLIVSPHPDDAAVSLGASILKYAPLRTTVWNIFTAQNYSLIDAEPRRARERILQEERAASEALGTVLRMGGFPEAELRGYSRLSDRLGHGETTFLARGGERDLLECLQREFRRVLAETGPAFLGLPLGAGGHVDHLLAREAVLAAPLGRQPRIFFYEDLPYALRPAWREQPPAQLEARGCRLLQRLIGVEAFLERKQAILEIYRSQLSKRDIRRLMDYSRSLGGAERIWLLRRT